MVAGVGVVAALGLSACDTNLWQGPIAVRGSGQSFELAVCTSGPIDEIFASYSDLSTDLDWVDFWVVDKWMFVAEGDVFVNGAIDGSQIGTFTLPEFHPGTELDIVFNSAQSPVASAVFKIPPEGLPAEDWLYPDDSVRSEPCEPMVQTPGASDAHRGHAAGLWMSE